MKRLLSVCAVVVGLSACADSGTPMSESAIPVDALRGGTTATDLGTLGGASAMATDINLQGTVVGWSQTAGGNEHAFKWTARGGMVDLGTLPGHQWSRAVSITSTGQILGESGPTGEKGTPVVWKSSGGRTVLPIPFAAGGFYREVADMNEGGQVVGSANSSSSSAHAWSWDRLFGFLDINTRIPGGFENYASRINNWGQVVGTNNASDAFNNYHAYTWNRLLGFHDLGVPAGADLRRTSLNGLGGNDVGQVVGLIRGPTSGSGVFTWSSSGGFEILDGWNNDVGGAGMGLNLLGMAVGNAWDGQRLIPAAWPSTGGVVALSPNQSGIAMAVNDLGSVVGWVTQDETSGVTRAMLWKVSGSPFLATIADLKAVATDKPGVMPRCFTEPALMRSRSNLIQCMAAGN